MTEAALVPAVPEGEARGEIAEVFADLRETLGLPFVSVVWRHLATIPGALPGVWAVVRPLFLSQELDARGADLQAAAAVPAVEPLPGSVWECVGLDPERRGEMGRLIEDYNRANSRNFLALETAGLVLRGAGRGTPRAATPARLGPIISAQPLPSLDGLPAPVRDLVVGIDELGRLGPSPAIASLYRHLAYWPPFLSVAYAALLPHHLAGTLQTAQQTLLVEGRGIAQEELLPFASPAALAPRVTEAALAAIDDFQSFMIGRMTVMGKALHALLPDGDE